MWRRVMASQLRTISSIPRRFTTFLRPFSTESGNVPGKKADVGKNPTVTGNVAGKRAGDQISATERSSSLGTQVNISPVVTGHEREELEAERKGTRILACNYPDGPFGTKEVPAIVQSYYNKRIVGCPGGEDPEDEHDVVWFWLQKDQLHECPVCRQVFALEIIGPGENPPHGHGEYDEETYNLQE